MLLLTHVWAPEIEAEFERLSATQHDAWLLIDRRTEGAASLATRYRCHTFDGDQLLQRPYPIMPGHGLINHPHFPVLDFFLAHRDYDRYWVVEYDVRYTGDWKALFDSLEPLDHDFVTSHIRRYAQEPGWTWWNTLEHPSRTIAHHERLRSFNVVYRLSNRALEFIHDAQLDGWRGYFEVSLPTLLFHSGFKVLDLGGDGDFAPAERKNAVYTSRGFRSGRLSPFATMRYRPARAAPGPLPDKIYHPVKPAYMIEPLSMRTRLFARWMWDFLADLLRSRHNGDTPA